MRWKNVKGKPMNHLESLDISTGGDLSDVYRPHVARLTAPDGAVFYVSRYGLHPKLEEATQLANAVVAHSVGQAYIGFDCYAYWEPERNQAALARKVYRGWRAEAVPAGA